MNPILRLAMFAGLTGVIFFSSPAFLSHAVYSPKTGPAGKDETGQKENRLKQEENGNQLIMYWLFDESMPNNTPLSRVVSTYYMVNPGAINFHSAHEDYPYYEGHPLWRTASMERRNDPTEINYRDEANNGILYEDSGMRGLQIRQPFRSGDRENTLILDLPTSGFSDVVLRFAARDEGAAESILIDYSVTGDPVSGMPVWSSEGLPETSYGLSAEYILFEMDFSDIEETGNNPSFRVRIRFDGPDMTAADSMRVTFNNISLEGGQLGEINHPPVVVGPVALQYAIEGGSSVMLDLGSIFEDPEDDVLTWSAVSSRPGFAETSVTGNSLEVIPLKRGDSQITVKASDGYNPPVEHSFRVLVYPGAHILSEANFSFTEWDPGSPELSFPENMIFLQTGTSDPGIDDLPEYPYYLNPGEYHPDDLDNLGFPYNLTRRTRIEGLDNDGISFINTGRGRDLGGALLAVSTTGMDEVLVNWLGGTVLRNERLYAIRLRYREGIEGPFTDLQSNGQAVEYTAGEDGHTRRFEQIALPAELLGKAYVQLLWQYYHVHGETGPRSQLRLDNIVVGDHTVSAPLVHRQEFSFYPNPAVNFVHVESNRLLGEIRLINAGGQAVYSNRVTGNSHIIELSGIPPGIYILTAGSDGRKITARLQIVR